MNNKGLLIINLGTPKRPDTKAVRQYLATFLADKRVIDLPAIFKYILLYAFILPFRPQKSAHAYQAIWTDQGSPLLCNSQALLDKLRNKLHDTHDVALGMRYEEPSIDQALESLKHCNELTIIPLYPQYSSAATGSSIEEVMRILSPRAVFPTLHIIRDFYANEGFIQAQLNKPFFGRPYLKLGQCFGLWGYMLELGGILGAKHAAKTDAFVSAFLGMSGAPGLAKGVLVEQASGMAQGHSLA